MRCALHRSFVALSWALPVVFLAWAARLVVIEGFLNELPKEFSGDFNSAITGAGMEGDWWAGQGLFYGPLFVLEWRYMLGPAYISITEIALLNVLLFALAFGCTWRSLFCGWRPRLLLVVLGLWLGNYVTVALFATAQHLEALELAFLSLALLLLTRAQPVAAGVSTGLAAATKTLPVVFFAYLAVLRQWRALCAAVILGVVIFCVTCAIQGVSVWDGALMLLNQGTNLQKTKSTPYEVGLRAFLIRLLTGGVGEPSAEQTFVAFGIHAVVAAASAIVTGWALARHVSDVRSVCLAWGLVAATMLVIAPVTHIFYFVFLLIAWTTAFADLIDRPLNAATAAQWLGLAAAYVFTGFDQPFVVAQRLVGVGGVVLDHWLDFLPLGLLLTIAVQISLLGYYHGALSATHAAPTRAAGM